MAAIANPIVISRIAFHLENLSQQTQEILWHGLRVVSETPKGNEVLFTLASKTQKVVFRPFTDLNVAFGVSFIGVSDMFYPAELRFKAILSKVPAFSDEKMFVIYLNTELIYQRPRHSVAFLECICFELGNLVKSDDATRLQENPLAYSKVNYVYNAEVFERDSLITARTIAEQCIDVHKTVRQQELFPTKYITLRLDSLPKESTWFIWTEEVNEYNFVHADFHRMWWDRSDYDRKRWFKCTLL